MIDQASIRLNKLRIEPESISSPEVFAIINKLPDLQVTDRSYSARDEKRRAILSLLPDNTIRVFAEQEQGEWLATKILVNLPKILWGHNGRLISSDEKLLIALERTEDLVSRILFEEERKKILPGLDQDSTSFWSSIEIPIHLADPNGNLSRAFRNMAHPRIRKASLTQGETTTLPGTNIAFKKYDKLEELRSRMKNTEIPYPQTNILRVELSLKGISLSKNISTECCEKDATDGPSRVVRFSVAELKECFLDFAADLDGVFHNPILDAARMPGFLAEIHGRFGVPTEELLEAYSRHRRLAPHTMTSLRRQVRQSIAHSSKMRFENVFSDAALANQPEISIPCRESRISPRLSIYGNRRDIAVAYAPAMKFRFCPRTDS